MPSEANRNSSATELHQKSWHFRFFCEKTTATFSTGQSCEKLILHNLRCSAQSPDLDAKTELKGLDDFLVVFLTIKCSVLFILTDMVFVILCHVHSNFLSMYACFQSFVYVIYESECIFTSNSNFITHKKVKPSFFILNFLLEILYKLRKNINTIQVFFT